jgi:hypothetical protein
MFPTNDNFNSDAVELCPLVSIHVRSQSGGVSNEDAFSHHFRGRPRFRNRGICTIAKRINDDFPGDANPIAIYGGPRSPESA